MAGIAVAVAGLFPIDTGVSTAIHNVAGFAIPIVLMGTVVGARVALGSLGLPFDRASAVIVLSVTGLFVATVRAHLLPYVVMELICMALIGAWLWLFEARLRWLTPDPAAVARDEASANGPSWRAEVSSALTLKSRCS